MQHAPYGDGDVVRIPLRRRDGTIHAEALVDAVDAAFAEVRWHSSHGYVTRNLPRSERGSRPSPRLHREILGLADDDPREVDHIDGDPLNNRRSNLRIVTHAQNGQNMVRTRYAGKPLSSSHRGVHWHATRRRWIAAVMVAGRRHHLGYFATEDAAAAAARTFRERNLTHVVEDR